MSSASFSARFHHDETEAVCSTTLPTQLHASVARIDLSGANSCVASSLSVLRPPYLVRASQRGQSQSIIAGVRVTCSGDALDCGLHAPARVRTALACSRAHSRVLTRICIRSAVHVPAAMGAHEQLSACLRA
eukprot:6200139-Pleurochrysis_carterae.AAC.2